jgi:hypothetical protein
VETRRYGEFGAKGKVSMLDEGKDYEPGRETNKNNAQ